MPLWLQVADGVAVASGLLALAGWIAALARERRLGAPVRGPALCAATPVHALAAFAAYFLGQSLLVGAATPDFTPAELEQIGSRAWHVLMVSADLGKCAVVAGLIAFFYSGRQASRARRQCSAMGAIMLAVGGFLAALPLTAAQAEAARVILEWSGHPIPEHPVILALQAGGLGPLAIAQLVVGAVVIAPVCEEVLFRGVVQDAVQNTTGRIWPAIIVSAVIFGLVHVPQPHAIVPLATLGILLGLVRVATGRLWAVCLLHALFNARTIVLVLCGATNT